MNINLNDLVEAKIISPDTARQITAYYEQRDVTKSGNKLVLVFGILGALLIGSGIVLIIAHNWDSLGKFGQLSLGLLPLLVAQGLSVYAFTKKPDSKAWLEVSSVLVFFAIATSISVVGQVYNLHSNLSKFLLVWIVLSLPLIYTHRSSLVSLLVWSVATWYGCLVSYNSFDVHIAPWYWAVVAALMPHYVRLLLKSPKSNFTFFHHWIVAGSLTTILAMFMHDAEELIILCYLTLFSIFVMIGQLKPFENIRVIANGFLVIGSLGIISFLLFLSFDGFWENITTHSHDWWMSRELAVSAGLAVIAVVLIIRLHVFKKITLINAKSFAFIAFGVLLVVGTHAPSLAQLFTNFLILALGIFTIRDGAVNQRLGILNYGLLIVTALIICRFFDTDLSFVLRGLLFVAVGAGFFIANYWMSKKKKQNPQKP
jgi:uncharacterized membrane protein